MNNAFAHKVLIYTIELVPTPSVPLSDTVLNRKNSGFSIPVREWLLQGEPSGAGRIGLRGWSENVYRLAHKVITRGVVMRCVLIVVGTRSEAIK